ncbi:hypothetical protein AC579_178 [Pseudocercospora musae]|uniref:Uncharacterized protein n=1 Tax=Pseudocercospora musae TaxID=113226 RepID=A0A139I0W5_9PEZI|nr:hypothetical protein AC579_178 [Pseudocercospora musae]
MAIDQFIEGIRDRRLRTKCLDKIEEAERKLEKEDRIVEEEKRHEKEETYAEYTRLTMEGLPIPITLANKVREFNKTKDTDGKQLAAKDDEHDGDKTMKSDTGAASYQQSQQTYFVYDPRTGQYQQAYSPPPFAPGGQ